MPPVYISSAMLRIRGNLLSIILLLCHTVCSRVVLITFLFMLIFFIFPAGRCK